MKVSNPLAPRVYLVRNALKTLPLVGVIALASVLIAWIVALMNSIPLSVRTVYSYSRFSLGVTPRGDASQTPVLAETIRTECPVPIDRIMVCRGSTATVKSIVGDWPFVVFGFTPEDLDYFLDRHFVSGIQGRRPSPGAPEVLISEPVARNLRLGLGDVLLSPDKADSYSPVEVRIVGIADSPEWMILTDIDYHRAHHFPPIDVLLVFAPTLAEQKQLDAWALERFKGEHARLFAFEELEKSTNDMFATLYRILNLVIATLVMVIALMVGMLMNIYQSQRLVEFGLLQAIGYTRRALLWRSLRETFWIIGVGWVTGVVVAHLMLRVAYQVLMHPRAWALNAADGMAFVYTLIVPLSIVLVGTFTVAARFRRFDPVSVVERRLV